MPTPEGLHGRSERSHRARTIRVRQQRREKLRSGALWGSLALVLLLIAGVTTYGLLSAQAERAAYANAVQDFDVVSDHVSSPVTYAQDPPAGGKHNGVWLNCGTYTQPVQSENAVHSMEHGASWVTYDPNLSEADLQTLGEALPSSYAILSPRDGLPAPVVASSWGHQIALTGADDPRLPMFLADYTLADDVPEPGAACSGGVDSASPLQGDPVDG